MTIARDARYVEINRRMSGINGAGAAAITLMMLAATWGNHALVVMIAVTQLVVIAFNIVVVNRWLLAQWGVQRAELLRAVVNVSSGVVLNHFAGWPLAGWLVLPYVALAFDHLGPLVARSVVVATFTAQDVVALHDGVHWQVPLAFTVAAIFCSAVSDVRYRVIRAMLVDADDQRHAIALAHEATKKAIIERDGVEDELRRAQKLEAIGRVAAGVAHEINTPLQFVGDNLSFLRTALETLSAHYAQVRALVANSSELRALEEATDVEFLLGDMPRAVADSLEGTNHVSRIVQAMKSFAHVDNSDAPKAFDLNAALRSVVTVAQNETKYVADVELDLGRVDAVVGLQGEVKQVFLNLLVNAAHAIADAGTKRGKIAVRTRREEPCNVVVEIADTGIGIPKSVSDLVFDPFFTTKDVGRGSGQGLAIARSIVQKHGGQLTFESDVGRGTTFYVRLPAAPDLATLRVP